MNDWRLLREYVDHGSEASFGQLMEKHMALVYWTCRRDLPDAQMAEDATQNVFLMLARKASALSPNVSISGWLFQASRFISWDMYRSEMRRLRHEETIQMREGEPKGNTEWSQVDPWLNDGLSALKSSDREAILLRYFEGLSVADVATVLGTTETNTRKRLSRAIERLRGCLSKKGVAVSGVALSALLAEHPARAVPPDLHSATLSTLSHGTIDPPVSHFHALFAKQGAHLLMNASKAKITAGVAVLVLATVGGLSTIGVRIHQRRALAAAIGPLGFADLTAASANTAPASPADPAARSEIEADYKRIIDGFNNGDVTPLASVSAPDIRIWSTTNPKSPSGNQPNFSTSPGAQMKSMDGGRWSRMGEILQGHPDMKGSLTLTSLTVHSNQAVGVSNMRWAAMANGQDHAPTGSILTLDETDEFDWQYRGGRWVIVKIVTLSQATHAV